MTSSMGRITSHIWNEKMQNVWHRQPGWVGCCCLGGCVFWKNVSRKIQNGSSSALCCCWLVLFVMKKTVRKKWSTSLLVGLVWFALVWLGLAWLGLVWLGLVWLLWVVGWLKNVGEDSKMVVPRLFVAVDCCCVFWKKCQEKNGVCLCWLVWFGLVWFGLVALGCWLVEKMLGKIARWLFLGSLLLLFGLVGSFGYIVALGCWCCWSVEKMLGKNSKIVVPRLFVAVDCCCLVWKMFGKN